MERSSQDFSEIDKLKSWLDAFRPLPSVVVAEMKRRNDVRFTYNSNAIEGNTLSQSETEMVLSSGITIGGKNISEHLEVLGHKEAIDYIEALATRDNSQIGQWQIKEINSLIINDPRSRLEAGRYRRVDVKSAGTEHLYPSNIKVPELMDEFEAWLASAKLTLHPVEYATEAHYRFVAIHPFFDGNGRTGRLLQNLLLLKAGYPHVVLKNDDRSRYINVLIAANREGDISCLLSMVIEEMQVSLTEYLSVCATAGDCVEAHPQLSAEVREYLTL